MIELKFLILYFFVNFYQIPKEKSIVRCTYAHAFEKPIRMPQFA